jgi:MFS family permease
MRWQSETRPVAPATDGVAGRRWKSIVSNPAFLRYSLTNTFCLTTMLLFLANYSYLIERDYQLGASESGYVLAFFNASLLVGVYSARILVPRFGVDRSIVTGLSLALSGWLCLLASSMNALPSPQLSLAALALASLGTGVVISLTIGQALIPFTYNAGTASAVFVCVQSLGSALINFMVNQFLDNTLTYISIVLAVSSLLALLSMLFIGRLPPEQAKSRI